MKSNKINGKIFHKALKAAIAVFFAAGIFCPKAFAGIWMENSQVAFSSGDFVLNTTTAGVDNTVTINQDNQWFNANWPYRTPINIDNSASGQTLTDYQQEIFINTQAMIQAGQMRSGLADLRFTDSDGMTPLNYYVASGSGTTSTGIYVKIPSIPGSQVKTIYMYSGNLSVTTSSSSAQNTFDLYENWQSGSINSLIWQTGGAADWSVVSSSAYLSNNSARSGAILPGQNSYIQTTLNLSMAASVTFYWAVSCQPDDYDSLDFFIDGIEAVAVNPYAATAISGETSWNLRVYNIPAGQHTLQWQFQRSAQGGTQGLECGWVDDIAVQKQAASTLPSANAGAVQSYSRFYTQGIFQSDVFDAGGQQAQVVYASWSYVAGGGTSVAMAIRNSDTPFGEGDASPAWSLPLVNNTEPNIGKGRYIQYQATLSGDGTTTPYLVEVAIDYISPPPAPVNFTGVTLTTSSIQWTWTESNPLGIEVDGFNFYSSTGGILAALLPTANQYVENFLSPNQMCVSSVAVYNSSGTNISVSAPVCTYADPPCNHSEVFQLTEPSGFTYIPIPTKTDIFTSTFTFTSNESTTTIAYYRVAFTTNPAYSITTADQVWIPTTTVVLDDSDNPVTPKPATYFWPLFNSTSWYFCSETYNQQNLPSGVTTLGPYSFQGCPSAITDLTAAPSTDTEGCIVLTWTAPSEYGTQVANLTGGTYILKAKSGFYITNDSTFNNADMSITISTNAVAGQKQSYTITGLTPGAFWGFAIKSIGSNTNISQISSNIAFSTATAANASAINHVSFTTLPQTAYVGTQTSGITVQTQDAANNPLKVASNTTLNLNSSSPAGSFGQGATLGLTAVSIVQGANQATFEYEDINSGSPVITVSDPARGWTPGWSQTETIIPGQAVRFMIDTAASGIVGTDQTITVRANDGFSAGNTSKNYQGDIVVTCTVAGITITPSTHSYTTSDQGQTTFTIGNNGNNSIAGPVTYSVQEVVNQDYKDVLNSMLVGNGGIIKARNGAEQWFTQLYSSGSTNGLFGLSSPDGINIWAAGAGGRVVASTNSGNNWNSYSTGLGSNLNGIYFVNASTGWAVGDGGNIIKSVNGGQAWASQASGTTNNLHSVYFINSSTGFAVGDSGTLLQTINSGQTWQSSSLGGGSLYKIYFCSDLQTGYIAADGGVIYKTSNGGAVWVQQTTPVTSSLYSINFFSTSVGYAAGASNAILRTTNGGATWSLVVSTAPSPNFYGISFVGSNSSLVTAVGAGGAILQTSDALDANPVWSTQVMSGVSTPFIWNALVITNPVVQAPAGGLLQGKQNPGLYVGVLTTNAQASTINQIIVKRSAASTCGDADITSINVYRDNNGSGVYSSNDTFIGGAAFSNGVAEISFPSTPLTFTGTTTYLLLMPQVSPTAVLGNTFGMELDFAYPNGFLGGANGVVSGIPFAQNNLPFIMVNNSGNPFAIVPSSCTVEITENNLSPTLVTQGQQNVLIASFTMTTDRAASPWQRLVVGRNGINNRDTDIQSIQIYKSNDFGNTYTTLIATAAFGTIVPGYAYLNISPVQTINNTTTNYYQLQVNISPTAAFYTPTSDARFWLSYNLSTSSFLLDGAGANGVQSSSQTFTSNQIRIQQALNTLTAAPVFTQPQAVDQNQVAWLQTLQLSVQSQGAQVNIIKIHVTEVGTASDSDVTSVQLYRSADGTTNFSASTDTLLGSGVISSGQGSIVLTNPEVINTPLPGFATYFIAASVYKRATPGDTIQLKVNSTDISLAGINVVSTANFPIYTSTATIQFHRDYVNVTPTDISPRQARVNDTGIVMAEMQFWVSCTATLTNFTLNLTGTGNASNISDIKLYTNGDNNNVFLSTDTLIGTGAYSGVGVSTITLTTPLWVYDSTTTVFVVYDFNANSAPGQSVGAGISNSGFTTAPPEYGFNFQGGVSGGYFQTAAVNLLAKQTPSVPTLALNVSYPAGIQVGGQTVYCSNQASSLGFGWQATALNGIAQAKYALASYSVFSTTSVPDLTGWLVTSSASASIQNLNLKHDTLYYLWVEAVSTDGYLRVTSVPVLVDLLPPTAPSELTDTSPKAQSAQALAKSKALSMLKATASAEPSISSFWVSWQPASDPVSGIWYYQLQERDDTSPVWHTVSTTTAAEFQVVKNTATDEGKFFYYRACAMNYAGTMGGYSDASAAAYLSLSSSLVRELSSYPNPFDSRRKNATITFMLNQNAVVIFKVFDLFGKQVKEWQISAVEGDNTTTWDGADDGGRKVAAGMYILYVEVQGSNQTVKQTWKIGVIH